MYTIFTNNNAVADFFKQHTELQCTVKWVTAPAMEVLTAARVAIRQGAVLLSNPMAGVNIPPTAVGGGKNQKINPFIQQKSRPTVINPYLTILATPPGDTVDFQSVKRVDDALNIYKQNARLRFMAHDDDSIQHFQLVDLDFMLRTLSGLLGIRIN